jgi:Family of unknown function (DUF6510)
MDLVPIYGNAIGGDLSGVFAFDVTTAVTTCAACRDTHVVASLRAYLSAPGIVLRCATCDAVQLRLVRHPERAWLDLSGVAVLAFSPFSSDGLPHDDKSRPWEATM